MEEIDLATVKKRAITGTIALTSRTFFLQAVNFGAMFLLTIFLAPEIFGIYFVVTAMVNFLNYFSDIGLAAALVQKKEEVTPEDLKTTFTIQQILVIFLVLFGFWSSGLVTRLYRLDQAGLWLYRALVFSFFLSSLKTIPSVILERKLDFNRLVIPQIVETILFSLVAVFLAWKGWGIASFTWAVIIRGISGLVLIYLISPWRPGLAFEKKTAKKLLSFGIPFQANSLLALIKDDFLTVFLGKVLPLTQVGYLGWAQKWANTPLRFIMDSVTKVSFPAYSRLQDSPAALKKGIEKALFTVCSLTFPALIGLAILASPLVKIIPRYLKWEPALLALYLFCFQAMLSSISTTLTNTLNAVGRIKVTLKLMVMWTALIWIFTLLFIYFLGFNGAALASLLVTTTVFIPVRLVKRIVDFQFFNNVVKPFISSLVMGLLLCLISPFLAKSPFGIILMIFLGVIIYSVALLILAKERVFETMNLVLGVIKK